MANFENNSLDTVGELIRRDDVVLGLGDGGAHYGMICDARGLVADHVGAGVILLDDDHDVRRCRDGLGGSRGHGPADDHRNDCRRGIRPAPHAPRCRKRT